MGASAMATSETTATGFDPRVAPSPDAMREHLGTFATGVTVITAEDADGPVGFACQSFGSLSLDPPLVLFCVGDHSRSWPRIEAVGSFCVNVLGEDQQELCRRFGSREGEKFDGLLWDRSDHGAPALRDVLLRVHAEVVTVHPGGDHHIVVGRVVDLERPRDGRPLVFYRGRFGLDA
jgi:3-hydroxy-9,10-secoandrosta-1,3,5(10)-triene-9,17-dione monooxygenase reductase component